MSISGAAAYHIAEQMKIDDVYTLHKLIIEQTSIDSFYQELKNMRSAYKALTSPDTDAAMRATMKPHFEEFAAKALCLIQQYYTAANL